MPASCATAMFHYMSPEEFDAVIKVHLYGAFYVSRAAATHFRKQESGAYVHMTSTSGLIGSIGQVNYGAAKLGIAGLSRCIAMDMQRYKVRSNCIGPHAFSRMIETVPGYTEEQMQARAAKTRPDQVAQLAAFLVSDAAAEVSGQIFGARGNEIYSVQSAAADPHHASRRRVDTRAHGRTSAAGHPLQPHAAGTHARRVQLGRDLTMRPFEGVRVIDITHVLAGPFAAYQLAVLGADVIKLEHPDDPDQSRITGSDAGLNRELMGTAFLTQGSNKRSLTADLKTEAGKEILRRLVRTADVLVENYRPGAFESLGLGYEPCPRSIRG